jgi:hypothetical protein
MLRMTPFAAPSEADVSSGTSCAGRQPSQPGRHIGAFGAITPAARAARSSSSRTLRWVPLGSAHLHRSSLIEGRHHTPNRGTFAVSVAVS